jgi:two-component system sensor histidine kinase EvgS
MIDRGTVPGVSAMAVGVRRWLCTLAGWLLAAAALASAPDFTADERAWMRDNPVVRVAVHDVAIPPLQVFGPEGRLSGIVGEYLAIIEQQTGLRMQPVRAPTLARRDADFREGRADLLPLLLAGDPVAADARVTEAFFQATPVFVTRRETTDFSPTGGRLGGLRVAMMPGGAFEVHLRQRFPDAHFVLVDSPAAELRAVSEGRADVRVGQLPTTVYTIESMLLANLTVRAFADGAPSTYAMGVRPSLPVLHGIVRKVLAGIGPAQHAAIVEKWVPVRHFLGLDARGLLLNDAERAWLRANPRIRVAYDRSFAPFSLQDDRRMQGLGPELLREVARRLGLEIVEERPGTWAQTYAAALQGQADVLVAAGRNDERREKLHFIGPWNRTPTALVTRREAGGPLEIGALGERLLALQDDHFLLPMLARKYPGVRLLRVPTLEDALAAVHEGRAAAALGNLNVVSNLIQRHHPGALTIGGTVPDGDSELFFAVPIGQPELAVVLAKGMESLSAAERNAIQQRWLAVAYAPGWRWQEVLAVFGPALLAALAAAFVVQRNNRRLQREVAQRRQAEARLEQSLQREHAVSASKSQFIASLSHEIRNPLSAMLAGTGLLAQRASDDQQRQLLAAVQQSGDGLLELLSRTLDFSKAESGMLTSRPEWVDPRDWVRKLCQAFEAPAAAKGLVLQATVEGPPGLEAHFDPVRLGQVLGNLLSNAVKFTDQGGVDVHLTLDAAGGELRLAVQDSGPGFGPDEKARLFVPYSQLVAARGAHPGGTGLGLALCKQIVEHLGGRIGATSEPGRGSCFSLALPVAWRTPDATAPPQPMPAMPADWRAHPVLLVDDDPVGLMLLQEQFRVLGIAVHAVGGGDEALAHWEAAPGRVLVTDCHMPGMDGFELARRIRQRPVAPEARPWIIAMTGSTEADEHARARASGADEVLVKPLSLQAWAERFGRPDARPEPSTGAAAGRG